MNEVSLTEHRLHNVRVGVVDTVPAAEVEQEVEMSAVCGYIRGSVPDQGVVFCPGGVSGKFLLIQIISVETEPACDAGNLPDTGCMLTLCEVIAETGIQLFESEASGHFEFMAVTQIKCNQK